MQAGQQVQDSHQNASGCGCTGGGKCRQLRLSFHTWRNDRRSKHSNYQNSTYHAQRCDEHTAPLACASSGGLWRRPGQRSGPYKGKHTKVYTPAWHHTHVMGFSALPHRVPLHRNSRAHVMWPLFAWIAQCPTCCAKQRCARPTCSGCLAWSAGPAHPSAPAHDCTR